MKIALVNLPIDVNIGGNLQRYALCCVLGQLGFDVIHIQIRFYSKLPEWKKLYVYFKRLLKKLLLNNKQSILFENQQNYLYEESLNNILPFYDHYVPHTEPLYDIGDIQKRISGYDAVIVGSDQVWRKTIAGKYLNTMLLGFMSDSVPRYAYAVSFGVTDNELSKNERKAFAEYYAKFRMVSVRERSGLELLSAMECNIPEAEHLLDPTFLLPKSQYEKLALSANADDIPSGDMFCYILDKSEWKASKIGELAYDKKMRPFGMTLDSKVDILHWLRSYSHAKYIVTDSYHGMVFALIFNKPFYVFENKFRGNERFQSLQDTFGVTFNEECPDWEHINDIIKNERKKSIKFLNKIK